MQPFNPKRPFLKSFESLGHYHDFFATVICNAPDKLKNSFFTEPIDETQALADIFESLHSGLRLAKSKVNDQRVMAVIAELFRMSHESYLVNDEKMAIRGLQEAEGMIWPSQRIRLELAAIAEKRMFGEVQKFKDAHPRRFDGEGTFADLGPGQRRLFDFVYESVKREIDVGRSFKMFPHAINLSGDLLTLRMSSSKAKTEMQRLANAGEISAWVRVDFFGVLIIELEERGQPRISARATWQNEMFSDFRFFLDDPELFPL